MLKVSKNNPLYKLALYWNEQREHRVPGNICPFIRHAIYGIAKGIFMTVMVLMVITVVDMLLVSFVWTTCALVFDSFVVSPDNSIFTLFGAISYVLLYAGLIVLLVIFLMGVIKNWSQRRAEKYTDRPPGVIAEYVKARHSKICVPIQFED